MKIYPLRNVLLRTPLQGLQKAYAVSPEISAIFEEGLYLSSPEYWQEYQKRDSLDGKSRDKVERSFTKYWLRSCTRCTPYATLAGCAVADVAEGKTNVTLRTGNGHTRRVRLDMNYLARIVQAISQIPRVQQQLKFYPNNSIYEVSTGFRYAEYTIENDSRRYQLTSVAKAPYIESVLHLAENGATLAALAALLLRELNAPEANGADAAQLNATKEEADAFIMDMWESQLLVSELEPAVTGPDPFDKLMEQLAGLRHMDELTIRLREIQRHIKNPAEGFAFYQSLERELKGLDLPFETPPNTLQVDLFLSTTECRLNKGLLDNIVRQAQDLMSLARQNKNVELDSFKDRFYARYENAEVPLAIALDADLGIGYSEAADELAGGTDLINDLETGTAGPAPDGLRNPAAPGPRAANEPAPAASIDYIQRYTLAKYDDCIRHNRPCITITEAELTGFRKETTGLRFPDSLFIMGSLMNEGEDNYVFDLKEFGGPGAANLLGRFTSGDEKLCTFTRELLQWEEQGDPGAIYGEIVHLPQARTGNVLLRPVLREYEIPYVGKSGAIADHQILIEDLFVSIQNNEVVLRSKKHNRRVIPRLTTAHNFGYNSLPVYKFLCHLQYQGYAQPNTWDWGPLSEVKQLPRVVYKNLIIKKAQWRIGEKDVDGLPGQPGLPNDPAAHKEFFTSFCERLKIPQRVVYVEHDNHLLIDFGEDKGIGIFLHYLRRHKEVLLEEFLHTVENCIVADVNGERYTNELIIPVRTTDEPYKEPTSGKPPTSGKEPTSGKAAAPTPPKDLPPPIQRKFSPYSQWLYFKVYCGRKTAERLLREVLLPFAQKGLADSLFEKFFFLRYKDEFSHLRIRFFNSDMDKQGAVQKAFSSALQPFLDAAVVDRVVVDTYIRELERYGPDLIEKAEQLFFYDSIAVLGFINLIEGAEGERYRLLFALRGIDMLLNDFGQSLSAKKRLLEALKTGLFREFGASPVLQKQLNDKYRKRQSDIHSHMNAANDGENEVMEAAALFASRSQMNLPVIKDLAQERAITLLPGLVHMFMNRLFIAQQRKYELVAYHFLEKYYTSQLAISGHPPVSESDSR